jgi:hypothetical protein
MNFYDRTEGQTANKNYMSIAGSVQMAKFSALNNFCAALQECSLNPATNHSEKVVLVLIRNSQTAKTLKEWKVQK